MQRMKREHTLNDRHKMLLLYVNLNESFWAFALWENNKCGNMVFIKRRPLMEIDKQRWLLVML